MTTIINDEGRLEGTETFAAQFLHGSKHVGQFPVKVIMDSADIGLVVKHALKDAVIQARKRIKTVEQAEALAEGVTFATLVSAAPKDANAMAAAIDPDDLSPAVLQSLLRKLAAKQGITLE